MLLTKAQITKPRKCRIIIGCSTLKFSQGSPWRERSMGLLTVASQRQSHWQIHPTPWQLETQVSFAIPCSKLAGWTPVSLSCQFSPEWWLPRLRHSGWPCSGTGSQPHMQGTCSLTGKSCLGVAPEVGGAEYWRMDESHTGWHTQTLTNSQGFPFWQGIQDYRGGTRSVVLGHNY